MFSVKFSAAVAAVLFISTSAAQAGGRPFVDSRIGSSQATILAWPIEDRGQANRRLVRSAPVVIPRLASRHRPVSKPVPTRLAVMTFADRPGSVINRLGAYYRPSIKFGNRPGSISVSFKAFAVGDIRFADRIFTSSLSNAAPASGQSAKFCVGSMAPCSVSFAPTQTALNDHRAGHMAD
jgi:hypothetical protein